MLDWWEMFNVDPGTGAGSGDEPPPDDQSQEDDENQEGEEDQVSRRELAKANREAAKYRRELRVAQSKIAELEGESKTELEKIQDQAKKAEDMLKESQSEVAELRVRILAEDVGIVRTARADAARLLDWSSVDDPSDDRQVVEALKSLVKDRPYLLGSGTGADGGAGSGQPPVQDMNRLLRQASGRG